MMHYSIESQKEKSAGEDITAAINNMLISETNDTYSSDTKNELDNIDKAINGFTDYLAKK